MEGSPVRALAEIASFHAHVYFDPGRSEEAARALRGQIAERFHVRIGRWHEGKVGPHGKAMYQIAFEPALFGVIVPWLMLNHAGLSILVHPNTTNARRDHMRDAVWIGPPVALDDGILPEAQEAERAGAPNTNPSLRP